MPTSAGRGKRGLVSVACSPPAGSAWRRRRCPRPLGEAQGRQGRLPSAARSQALRGGRHSASSCLAFRALMALPHACGGWHAMPVTFPPLCDLPLPLDLGFLAFRPREQAWRLGRLMRLAVRPHALLLAAPPPPPLPLRALQPLLITAPPPRPRRRRDLPPDLQQP